MIKHSFNDNKYTVIFFNTGELEALRYGESWRNLTGDSLVLAMLQEVDELKEQNNQLEQQIECLYDTIGMMNAEENC